MLARLSTSLRTITTTTPEHLLRRGIKPDVVRPALFSTKLAPEGGFLMSSKGKTKGMDSEAYKKFDKPAQVKSFSEIKEETAKRPTRVEWRLSPFLKSKRYQAGQV
ncbi:hypothetical protein HDU93_004048 [Gonapodya sp. JEL0774]|nr:hypothetical protein HDU93_004048 [Gonapodya sp. JEL0774]